MAWNFGRSCFSAFQTVLQQFLSQQMSGYVLYFIFILVAYELSLQRSYEGHICLRRGCSFRESLTIKPWEQNGSSSFSGGGSHSHYRMKTSEDCFLKSVAEFEVHFWQILKTLCTDTRAFLAQT